MSALDEVKQMPHRLRSIQFQTGVNEKRAFEKLQNIPSCTTAGCRVEEF